MLKIGLTGGIGSGKTTVTDLFISKGVNIIDTDVITHQLLASDDATKDAIVNSFGNIVLDSKGNIDRKQLAAVVFGDVKNKSSLESILHPRIRKRVSELILEYEQQDSDDNYLIIVIPLLFETGFDQLIDRNLVVLADESVRIDRVLQRDTRKLDEIRSIISSQVDDSTRRMKADDIIENNSDIKQLGTQVDQIHEKYLSLPHS